jgi:hypothetical protein
VARHRQSRAVRIGWPPPAPRHGSIAMKIRIHLLFAFACIVLVLLCQANRG